MIDPVEKSIRNRHKAIFKPVWHFDKILKYPNASDLNLLYDFYHRQVAADLIPMNLPVGRLVNMLPLSHKRIKTAKRELIQLGYIREVRTKNKKTNKLHKSYTYLPFFLSDAEMAEILNTYGLIGFDEKGPLFHGVELDPQGGSEIKKATRSISTGSKPTPSNKGISLSGNNNIIKDLSGYASPPHSCMLNGSIIIRGNPFPKRYPVSHMLHPKNKLYHSIAKKFYSILAREKRLNPKTKLEALAKEIRLLAESDLPAMGYATQEATAEVSRCFFAYFNNFGARYWPQIFGASQIRKKFRKLQSAVDRLDSDEQDKLTSNSVSDGTVFEY